MGEKTVTISAPIRDRDWVIPYYLENIYKIKYPKRLINLLFVVNNSSDNSEQLLKDFKLAHESEYNKITIDYFNKAKNIPKDERVNETRIKYTYSHLANLRNYILSKVETDYLLSCDCDILMPSNIINKLLSAQTDICAGLIYNGYELCPEEPWRYPNILIIKQGGVIEHVANSWVKNAPTLTESKHLSIGVTGAICMMSKEVCKNTKYGFHEQGEDAYWSIDCLRKGYKIYCDASAYCEHLMNKGLLEKYLLTSN